MMVDRETQEPRDREAIFATEGYHGPHDLSAEERADALAVRLAEAEEALLEARDGLREAREYGLRWPIGLDTEPQEQRGMDRDTLIRNSEFFVEQIDVYFAASRKGVLPCGHPVSAVVTDSDLGYPGTSYCGMCASRKEQSE